LGFPPSHRINQAANEVMPDIDILPAIFQHVSQYTEMVEQLMPWSAKMNYMAKKFVAFSIVCKRTMPPHMFGLDAKFGSFGSHEKVAVAFLVYLRLKGQAVGSEKVLKAKTVKQLWSQTCAGLKHNLAHDTEKPAFCLAGGMKMLLVKKAFQIWAKEDLKREHPKSYLLEDDIERFCLEVMWMSMQVAMAR